MTERADPRDESARESRRASTPLVADGSGHRAGLFDAHIDPVLTFEIDGEAARVTGANRAYRDAFGVDDGVEAPLEERLRVDLGSDDPTADEERDVAGAITDISQAASRSSHHRTIAFGETETDTMGESGDADATGETDREYLIRVVPVGDDGGYLVLTDVTPERERIRELRARYDRIDEFAASVSHDLRNPLEVAKIHLEAAERSGDDAHFRTIEGALHRIERIISEMLTLAREGQVIDETAEVDLEAVVEGAWASVSTPDASLSIETSGTVEADRERLLSLLENLFRNAVEHGGADVTVDVGTTAEGFYVADDGPGIPEAERDRVFESGYSTGEEGTGLGLRIVKRIAEAHGWTVEVTDGAMGGAMFVFRT